MLKEIIIIVSIIFIVIGGDVFIQMYTKKSVELMNNELETLGNSLLQENPTQQQIQTDYDKAIQVWEKRFKILAYYIEHDELEKVKTELIKIQANVQVKKYEESLEELETCKYILEHIQEKESLTLMNVF